MELLNGVVKWRMLNIFVQQPKTCVHKLEPQNLSLTLVNKTFVHFLESVFLN